MVDVIWGAIALAPLLALFVLLALAIKRQRSRLRDVPRSFGDGPPDVREPRRPLVPLGSASAAQPLPQPAELASDAVSQSPASRSEGPDSLAV